MPSRHVDMVIVGHGLAGASLAWTLRQRGQQVVVIDATPPSSASKVAAGLITPLSGPKLVPSWGWETAWPKALRFYREIEQLTGTSLLNSAPAVRLFSSFTERQKAEKDYGTLNPDFQLREADPRLRPEWYAAAGGMLEMMTAARLNIPEYLDVSRSALLSNKNLLHATIDPLNDLVIGQEDVAIPRLELHAGHVIFCQGFVSQHPYFGNVRFNPAKGQMLTIHAPGVTESRVLHSGLWMAAEGQERYRVGATFEWDQLNCETTERGRAMLVEKLKVFVRFPFSVVDQHAAVRPTMHDFRPALGSHPQHPRLAILNGLGTKGSLWAPWLAELLASHLLDGTEISKELDVRRWFR